MFYYLVDKAAESEKGDIRHDEIFWLLLAFAVGLIEIATYPIWRPVLWVYLKRSKK